MLQRVAVTGAAGFLGSHVVNGLAARGTSVLPLVRAPDARSERWRESRTLDAALKDPALLEGCQVVIHAAAVRHRYGVDASEYRASNVEVVEALLKATARARVGRFVLVSSVGVYGFPTRLPITETHPFAPVTLYAETKVVAERLARRVAAELGLELCIVRPTIVYGPGDNNGMLDKTVRMIRAGSYRVVGRGNNTLHHTHIDDLVSGVLLAAEHPGAVGEDFILAGPETITLARFSSLVARSVGEPLPRLYVPLRAARAVATVIGAAASAGIAFSRCEPPINHEKLDVMTLSTAFDVTKAKRVLGYEPVVRYEDGLRRTLGDTR